MIKIRNVIAVGALAMGLGGAANAEVFDFSYNGGAVATLTTSGNTDFALSFLSAPGGASAFINDLFLSGPGGTFGAAAGQTTSATAEYDALGLGDANAYNWHLNFPTANNATRFGVGETYTWSITSTNPDAWDLSMLHINAFLNGESIKLDGCVRGDPSCVKVPEPGTFALMGLGLLGMGLARRYRRRA